MSMYPLSLGKKKKRKAFLLYQKVVWFLRNVIFFERDVHTTGYLSGMKEMRDFILFLLKIHYERYIISKMIQFLQGNI